VVIRNIEIKGRVRDYYSVEIAGDSESGDGANGDQ